MVVLPAGSVADTVTVFLPACKATVADHVPSEPTVVFTPLTVTAAPGSALPVIIVFEPVTFASDNLLIFKAGAAVSF